MSKELIDRIRELQAKDWASPNEVEAADLIEQQQKRIDGIERKVDFWRDKAKEQMQQLATSQAQIAALCAWMPKVVVTGGYEEEQRYLAAMNCTDDSALRELLKAERERCAKVCDEIHSFHFVTNPAELCAINIRAMEDQ